MFHLLILLTISVIIIISYTLNYNYYGITIAIFSFLLIVPSLAVSVRRLHDLDISGLFVFVLFVPVANIVIAILFCSRGTLGRNRFGPDPLQEIENLRSGEIPSQSLSRDEYMEDDWMERAIRAMDNVPKKPRHK